MPIAEELTLLQFTVLNIHQITRRDKNSGDDIPLPLFKVRLPNTPRNKLISNTSSLCFYTIKVEEPDHPGFSICSRCCRYQHTARYCGSQPVCAKCPSNHLTKDCPLPPTAVPYCRNCEGTGHLAFSKICPAYRHFEETHPHPPKNLRGAARRAQQHQQQPHHHQIDHLGIKIHTTTAHRGTHHRNPSNCHSNCNFPLSNQNLQPADHHHITTTLNNKPAPVNLTPPKITTKTPDIGLQEPQDLYEDPTLKQLKPQPTSKPHHPPSTTSPQLYPATLHQTSTA